jgi:hypothetical protein
MQPVGLAASPIAVMIGMISCRGAINMMSIVWLFFGERSECPFVQLIWVWHHGGHIVGILPMQPVGLAVSPIAVVIGMISCRGAIIMMSIVWLLFGERSACPFVQLIWVLRHGGHIVGMLPMQPAGLAASPIAVMIGMISCRGAINLISIARLLFGERSACPFVQLIWVLRHGEDIVETFPM